MTIFFFIWKSLICLKKNETSQEIIDMSQKDKKSSQEIKLDFKFGELWASFCNFNKKGDLILFCRKKGEDYKRRMICVFSIQTKNNAKRTKCQKVYMIQKGVRLINISKDNKIWLRLCNDIYEWDKDNTTIIYKNIVWVIINYKYYIVLYNIVKFITILFLKNKQTTRTRNIKISNNDDYTCLKVNNEIIIYSNPPGLPIASSLDLNDGIIFFISNIFILYIHTINIII